MSELHDRHSGLSVLAMVAPVGASCLIISMKAADLLGVSSLAAVLTVAVLLAVGLVVIASGVRPHRVMALRVSGGEAVQLGALALVSVALWARALQRVLDTPVVYSVDPARHVSLTAWIVEHQRLVHAVEPQLGGLSNYPPGAHVLAAIATWVTRASPLATTWLVAVGSVLALLLLVIVIPGEVLADRNPVPGLVAVCLYLVAWRFTVGMVTYEFFFSQSVGLALSLGGVLAVVSGLRAGDAWWRWVPLAGVTGIASFLTYPQQAVVVPAVIAAGLWTAWRRTRSSFTPRNGVVAVAAIVAVSAGAVLVLRRSGYLSTGAFFGAGEGSVATLSLARVGGWVPVVLVMWGIVAVLWSTVHRVPGALVVFTALAVPVGMALGLWMLQHGFPVRAPVTQYRIAKNVFTAVPLAAVVAGIGVGMINVPRWARSRAVAFGAAVVTVLVPLQPRTMANTRYPVVSRDAYDLAIWAGDRHDVTDIGLAGPDLEPFTLWIAGLRRPLDPDPAIVLLPFSTRWNAWPKGDTTEHYLLVSGKRLVARYAHRPGVKLVRRQGHAALFKRI